MVRKSWLFSELPKGFYSASISRRQTWQGKNYYVFTAYPNRGNWCIEGSYLTEGEAIDAGNRFASGETGIAGIYSATI